MIKEEFVQVRKVARHTKREGYKETLSNTSIAASSPRVLTHVQPHNHDDTNRKCQLPKSNKHKTHLQSWSQGHAQSWPHPWECEMRQHCEECAPESWPGPYLMREQLDARCLKVAVPRCGQQTSPEKAGINRPWPCSARARPSVTLIPVLRSVPVPMRPPSPQAAGPLTH